ERASCGACTDLTTYRARTAWIKFRSANPRASVEAHRASIAVVTTHGGGFSVSGRSVLDLCRRGRELGPPQLPLLQPVGVVEREDVRRFRARTGTVVLQPTVGPSVL